jgi:uncharacterized protein with GYD domain
METYFLMTKLSPDVTKRMRDRAAIGRAWLEKVRESCPDVKFVAHYGLLGPFDFVDIYEAPNAETAAKVSMISLANGALQAESWVALPYQKIVDLAQDL